MEYSPVSQSLGSELCKRTGKSRILQHEQAHLWRLCCWRQIEEAFPCELNKLEQGLQDTCCLLTGGRHLIPMFEAATKEKLEYYKSIYSKTNSE